MSGKQIFLTGATGLVGSSILKELLHSGYACKAMYRRQQPRQPGVEWFQGDLLEPATFESSLAGVDTVIHAGALVSYSGLDRDMVFKTNYLATRDLVNAALSAGVRRFILISAASTLRRSTDSDLIALQTPGQPVFQSSYAESKFLAELEVWRGAAEGFEVCILNPAMVIGEESQTGSSMKIIKAVENGLPAYPPGSVGLITAGDVAAMVSKVLDGGPWDSQLLLCAETWTYGEFLNEIAKTLGKDPIEKKMSLGQAWWYYGLSRIGIGSGALRRILSPETIRMSFSSPQYVDTKSLEIRGSKYSDIRLAISRIKP